MVRDNVADIRMHAVLRRQRARVGAPSTERGPGGAAQALHGAAAMMLQPLPKAPMSAGHVRIVELRGRLELLRITHQDLQHHMTENTPRAHVD